MITSIVRKWFSNQSKVGMQNFFEINPIHPSNAEQDYKVYKEAPKPIKPLEFNFKQIKKQFSGNDYIEARIKSALRRRSDRDRYLTNKIVLEAQTKLPLGMGFNWYIERVKGRSSQNFSLRYVEIVSDLIKKFQVKSEPQLVRYFRIAIADSKSDDMIKQMRGSMLQNIVLESAKRKGEKQLKNQSNPIQVSNQKPQVYEGQELEQKRKFFYQCLKEIDKNISVSQKNLKIHDRHSLRHDLYDTNYPLPDEIQKEYPMDADYANDNVVALVNGIGNQLSNETQSQDYLIQQRIRRLYFLKKLQLQKQEQDKTFAFKQQYTLHVGDREYQIAKTAAQYNLLDIVPQVQIDDLYNTLDLFLSHLDLKAENSMTLQDLKNKIKKPLNSSDLLWENINVNKILGNDYEQPDKFQVPEDQKYNTDVNVQLGSSVQVTPDNFIQTTLNNAPFNVYQYTDMAIFGHTSQNRSFGQIENILSDTNIDTKDIFRRYQFQNIKEPPPDDGLKWVPPERDVYDYGKRKSSTVLCRIRPGTGIVNINKKNIRHYFPEPYYRAQALRPAIFTGMSGKLDVDFFVGGSGIHSQSTACANALSRALYKAFPRLKKILRRAGLVTMDRRIKQRKHSGHYKARKSYIYVRR